jgi:hypothetical protein
VTYTNRIEELRRLDPAYSTTGGKSLPARPMSGESLDAQRSMLLMDDDEPPVVQTASIARIVNDRSADDPPFRAEPEPPPTQQLPLPELDHESLSSPLRFGMCRAGYRTLSLTYRRHLDDQITR